MPDLIRKHFGYGQLWLLKYYDQHAARIGLDCICLIQLPACNSVLFFQRRHGSYCTKPISIQSGWPDQVLGKCISSGSKSVGKNHRAQFLAECNWPATSFPLSDSVAFSHRWPRSHCAQPAWVRLVLADYARFWPDGSSPEASLCARIIQPASGQCLQADPVRCGLDLACLLARFIWLL